MEACVRKIEVKVRLTKEEHAAIKARADASGLAPAAWIRMIAITVANDGQ